DAGTDHLGRDDLALRRLEREEVHVLGNLDAADDGTGKRDRRGLVARIVIGRLGDDGRIRHHDLPDTGNAQARDDADLAHAGPGIRRYRHLELGALGQGWSRAGSERGDGVGRHTSQASALEDDGRRAPEILLALDDDLSGRAALDGDWHAV